ncbi:lactadherin-like [Actinia tenebrosa]|uniref:Lactadherin-like n=1 Tax=Actinia tenebrosa TaxID=6105 RepID=A0A6P8IZ58_ACTTE|nr:lactadherin-like [Actinia tenebrosa]
MSCLSIQHCGIFILGILIRFSSSIEIRQITFNIPVKNMKLTNHEIAYLRVGSQDVCMEACFLDPNCVSINYYPTLEESYENCELSSSDDYLCPEDFVFSKGTVYFGIQNQCHGAKCYEQNMTCQSGFPPEGYKCVAPLCYEGPLGMEDKRIPDSSISASSEYGKGTYLAKNGRLRSKCNKCVWAAEENKVGEFLQVDLGHKMVLTKVQTQGNVWMKDQKDEWVTEYYIAYSQDRNHWQNYTKDGNLTIFDGNNDGYNVVTNDFNPFIRARHVRIVALDWKGHITLSAELYGCKPP